MAREVVTRIWCDVCLDNDQYAEGVETPPITIGSLKPRVLALCERHQKEVFEPMRELLTNLGQVLPGTNGPAFPGTSPGSGVWPCPVPNCPKNRKPYGHEQSLRNHARQVHHLPISELRERVEAGEVFDESLFGDAVEARDRSNNNGPPEITEARCDQTGCDKKYVWPETRYPAIAMGLHRRKTHGISGEKSSLKRKAG